MEENKKLVESLLEKAAEYGKTSFELIKLKAVDKSSDAISSFIPHSVVFILIIICMIFLNFGLAFWIGDILGKSYYGFFIIAAFYGISGIIIHFFMHNWFKKLFRNFFIKQLLN